MNKYKIRLRIWHIEDESQKISTEHDSPWYAVVLCIIMLLFFICLMLITNIY